MYNGHNLTQAVQTYYDEWMLTGLNVREDHGATIATIWEDPTVDDDLAHDGALWMLSHGLEQSFLAGRDQDNNKQRDVTLDEIVRRFDYSKNGGVSDEQRWSIPNILSVELRPYEHLDRAVAATGTESKRILEQHFSPRWSAAAPIAPTLMFAREERYRAVGLDGVGNVGRSCWRAVCQETGMHGVRREARCGIPAPSRRN